MRITVTKESRCALLPHLGLRVITVNTDSFTLNNPEHATVDSDDGYVISDTDNHRVLRCTSSGSCTIVAGTGSSGDALNELKKPAAVALDSDGDYVIADSENNRVIKCPAASPGANCEVMVTALVQTPPCRRPCIR